MPVPVLAAGCGGSRPFAAGTDNGLGKCALLYPASGAGKAGDVAGAIENTWNAAKGQIQTVVNNVVFPVCDMILAILFLVKVGTAYFDYRKHGQFEFAAPCILFACLIFCLTAPLYIWSVI